VAFFHRKIDFVPSPSDAMRLFVLLRYMTGSARESATRLLDGGTTDGIASWADDYRRGHPETGPWHYVSPTIGARFALDKLDAIPSLCGLGYTEARKALPALRHQFFEAPTTGDFQPYHSL
jgi:hypothetical protein